MAYLVSCGVWKVDTDIPEPYFEFLDGDTSKLRLVDQEPDGGTRITGLGTATVGRPVLPDHMPTRARRGGPGVDLYPQLDFHNMRGRPVITQTAKDLIERFEPETHQFFPIEVTIGKDDRPYGQYYHFFPCNRLDTIDRTLTNPLNERGFYKGTFAPFGHPKRRPDDTSRLVLDSKVIGSCHVWQEKFNSTGDSGSMWMSDVLTEAILEQGLTGLGSVRIEETKDLS